MKRPVARSAIHASGDTSGSAPHQLWPAPVMCAAATILIPAAGIAIASSSARMIVSSPLGVLKKRMSAAEAIAGITLPVCGHDEPLRAVPLEEADAVNAAEHERGGGERIGEHRA